MRRPRSLPIRGQLEVLGSGRGRTMACAFVLQVLRNSIREWALYGTLKWYWCRICNPGFALCTFINTAVSVSCYVELSAWRQGGVGGPGLEKGCGDYNMAAVAQLEHVGRAKEPRQLRNTFGGPIRIGIAVRGTDAIRTAGAQQVKRAPGAGSQKAAERNGRD